jgi:hypothetical protein
MINLDKNTLILDFESFFSHEYSLKELTPEAYIRGPEFQSLVLALTPYDPDVDHPIEDFRGPDAIAARIAAQDWESTTVIAQNASFDSGILSAVYGVQPAFIIDTMSMARGLFGPWESASLKALAAKFGLAEKSVPYASFVGKRFEDLDPATLDALAAGCRDDVALTREIARRLLIDFPEDELEIVDMTCRMFSVPVIEGNKLYFRGLAFAEATRKEFALATLGVSAKELRSAPRLVELLEAEGVNPPRKDNKTQSPSFAKTDQFMRELTRREDRAGALGRARIDVNSSIDETRAISLADMASRGPLMISLNYCGAFTKRWSGGGSINVQNFPREGAVKQGLCAPHGYRIIDVDLSQIEYRNALS